MYKTPSVADGGRGSLYHKKWVSLLYRAATTKYPCFDQDLGDSMGAGRIGLTRVQRYAFFCLFQNGAIVFYYLRRFFYLCTRNVALSEKKSKPKTGSAWIS